MWHKKQVSRLDCTRCCLYDNGVCLDSKLFFRIVNLYVYSLHTVHFSKAKYKILSEWKNSMLNMTKILEDKIWILLDEREFIRCEVIYVFEIKKIEKNKIMHKSQINNNQ